MNKLTRKAAVATAVFMIITAVISGFGLMVLGLSAALALVSQIGILGWVLFALAILVATACAVGGE